MSTPSIWTNPVRPVLIAADLGAPGGPGALSHFDLARKDCLGTARNTESRVWYTVAGGCLSRAGRSPRSRRGHCR